MDIELSHTNPGQKAPGHISGVILSIMATLGKRSLVKIRMLKLHYLEFLFNLFYILEVFNSEIRGDLHIKMFRSQHFICNVEKGTNFLYRQKPDILFEVFLTGTVTYV